MDNQVLDRYDTQGFNNVRAVAADDPVSQMRAREREIAELMESYFDEDDHVLDCIHNEVIDPEVFSSLIRAGRCAYKLKDDAHLLVIAKSLMYQFDNAMRIKAEAA